MIDASYVIWPCEMRQSGHSDDSRLLCCAADPKASRMLRWIILTSAQSQGQNGEGANNTGKHLMLLRTVSVRYAPLLMVSVHPDFKDERGNTYMWSRCGEDDQTGKSSSDASVLDTIHDIYCSARKYISRHDVPSY